MPERIVDGQMDFVAGVDSSKSPTIASANYPNGLPRNGLAWLTNGTVRGTGILQRTGWKPLVQDHVWPGLYQGDYLFQPDFSDPYLIVAIGGRIYRVRVDLDNSIEDVSALNGDLTLPASEDQYFFCQAEQFLVIQCGDLTTKPLFYYEDPVTGNPTLRQSNGFVGVADPTNEIPAAGPMCYHMNRLFYAIGRRWMGGDIVLNPTSGTVAFQYRDSVLHTFENPTANGTDVSGDAFIVPTIAGNIRALSDTSNLDDNLGDSTLYIFTRDVVYAATIPITRDDWIATDLDTMPLQKIALKKGGAYSDRSVVSVNGDLFYQSLPNGDIRSLKVALRYQEQWGNLPISRNENRVLRFNDRSLLRFGSGMEFDNRLWQTVLPFQTPVGVAHRGITILDFDLISSLSERLPPAWEGMYEDLDILQITSGDFGGLERAFAFVVSRTTGNIDLWEFTTSDRFNSQVNNAGNRVEWAIEFPAYTWGDMTKIKRLTGGALWLDKILGTVEFRLQYRPNMFPCWIDWHAWKECTAKDCRDIDGNDCLTYGEAIPYCESYMPDREFPDPGPKAVCIGANKVPSNIGYQFQARLIIRGWCRIRAFMLYAEPFLKTPYGNMSCPPPPNL